MRVAATLFVLLVSSTASQGQEDGQVPKKMLKELQYLAGQWTVEGRVGEEKIEGTWSARWAPGKHCLMRHSTGTEGGEEAIGIGVIGWDAVTETITEQVFVSNNDSALLRWKVVSQKKWEGELTGMEDGKAVTSKITLTKNGRNEGVYEAVNQDGEEVEVVLRRVPRKKVDTGVPEAALKELEYRVGAWESTGIIDGVKQEKGGQEVTDWMPGKYCTRVRSSWFDEEGVENHGTCLIGWDAENNQLVEHWYTADGGYGTFRYDLDKKKNSWVGTFRIFFGDGKKIEGTSVVEKKSNDEWECTTEGVIDGKKQTWRSINRRVKS